MAKNNVICDTDVMIDYWDQSKPRYAATKAILENDIGLDQVALSAITKMELMAGALNKVEMRKITRCLRRFNTVLINDSLTLKAINLIESYRLSHSLSLPDGLIAATASLADMELFTYNARHYKFIPQLRLYTP